MQRPRGVKEHGEGSGVVRVDWRAMKPESEDTCSVAGVGGGGVPRDDGHMITTYHVVIIEEAQGCNAVVVPVDSHHGLRGRRQGVFKVGLPGLILISVGELLEVNRVVL